jgi:uncharacterized membrane protein YcaP (DUF421 family)
MFSLHNLFGLSQEQAHHSLWFVSLETILLLCIFMVLIELAGRKTVAQMTSLQMIITIGIGEALLMPIVDKEFSMTKTVVVVSVMVLFLILNEWLEVKFNWYERLFTRKSTLVIEDGKIIEKNLKKIRMTVDQLEMDLRNLGIESLKLLKTATVEGNGKIGYQLKAEEQPLTVKDLQDYMNKNFPQPKVKDDIFEEIRDTEHGIESDHTHVNKLK